jgi:UPF0176 protein
MAEALHNRVNKKELKQRLQTETIKRKTISFYKYVIINNPHELRDQLFSQWKALNIFGRIYIAVEGINAQMSVPEAHWDEYLKMYLSSTPLKTMVSRFIN